MGNCQVKSLKGRNRKHTTAVVKIHPSSAIADGIERVEKDLSSANETPNQTSGRPIDYAASHDGKRASIRSTVSSRSATTDSFVNQPRDSNTSSSQPLKEGSPGLTDRLTGNPHSDSEYSIFSNDTCVPRSSLNETPAQETTAANSKTASSSSITVILSQPSSNLDELNAVTPEEPLGAPLSTPMSRDLTSQEIISGFGYGSRPAFDKTLAKKQNAIFLQSPPTIHTKSMDIARTPTSGNPPLIIKLPNEASPHGSNEMIAPNDEVSNRPMSAGETSEKQYTVADIIAEVQRNVSEYSIEEFTASAAFGVPSFDFKFKNSYASLDDRSTHSSGEFDQSNMKRSRPGSVHHPSSVVNDPSLLSPGSYAAGHSTKGTHSSLLNIPNEDSTGAATPRRRSIGNGDVTRRWSWAGNSTQYEHALSGQNNLFTPKSKTDEQHDPAPRRGSYGNAWTAPQSDLPAGIAQEMGNFERTIKTKMYPQRYYAGEYIIRKHEIGKDMYFISKGQVEVVSGDGKTVYSTIHKGSFFGELGVLFSVPRTASVRAVVDTLCMVLTRDSLDQVLQSFPNIAARFRAVAEQRMNEITRRRSYRKRLELKSHMAALTELPEETLTDEKLESEIA
ncbi:Kinesin-like protein kif27 [Quaeritorhiza haematococci]|nr:Kinesin-like protein kif27 [Quaeritorhiza haematococci]